MNPKPKKKWKELNVYQKVNFCLNIFINLLLLLNLAVISLSFIFNWHELKPYVKAIHLFEIVSILIFSIEILFRIYWEWKRPGETDAKTNYLYFFYSRKEEHKIQWHRWNIFDFVVTLFAAITLVSGFGDIVGGRIIRILRLLRITRIAKMAPFGDFAKALTRSFTKISPTIISLMLIFFIYTIIGFNIFREVLPEYFGGFSKTIFTLFQVMTLDSVASIARHPALNSIEFSHFYFVSFIIITSYILINCVVGVIVSSFEQQREEKEKNNLNKQLDDIKKSIYELNKKFHQHF